MADQHPLRTYRERNQLSVAQLAAMLGVSRATVFRWEGGQRSVDRKLWSGIADKTGIPIADIAGASQPLQAAQ